MGSIYFLYPYYIIPLAVVMFLLVVRKIPMIRLRCLMAKWFAVAGFLGSFGFSYYIFSSYRSSPDIEKIFLLLPTNVAVWSFGTFLLGYILSFVVRPFIAKDSVQHLPNPRKLSKVSFVTFCILTVLFVATGIYRGYGEDVLHTLNSPETDAQTLSELKNNSIIGSDVAHQIALAQNPNTPIDILIEIITSDAVSFDVKNHAIHNTQLSCRWLVDFIKLHSDKAIDLGKVSIKQHSELSTDVYNASAYVQISKDAFIRKSCAGHSDEELFGNKGN